MGQMQRRKAEAGKSVDTTPEFANILVVDDQRFDRKRLRRICGELGFDVHVVEADSLETMGTALDAHQFDLVFLDFCLPDGTGLDAWDAIQLSAKNLNAAAIMVTGGADQADAAIGALKRGFSDYIEKDVLSANSVRRAAINALQKRGLRNGLETQERLRAGVEKILDRFSRECVDEMRPMLSNMMRNLRNLSSVASGDTDQFEAKRVQIENACLRLFEFLEDLGGYQDMDLIKSVFPDNPLAAPASPVSAPTGTGKLGRSGPELADDAAALDNFARELRSDDNAKPTRARKGARLFKRGK